MKRLLLVCLLAAGQWGCLSLSLARAVGSSSQERFESRPQEAGAHLRCNGRDCAAVPLSATFKRNANPWIWGLGTALEIGGGGYAYAVSQGDSTPLLTIGSLLILVVGFTDLIAGEIGFSNDEFEEKGGCCKLDQRAVLGWKGQRIALQADDLLDPQSKHRPLRYFSVQRALAERQLHPESYKGKLTSAADAQGMLAKGTKLAVLEFKNHAKEMPLANVRYFGNLVRGAALLVAPSVDVMTEENLVALLTATGKDLASCEGECEVDTGRRIGADAVVSGELLRLGDEYRLTLHLYDTRTGKLLNAQLASGKSVDDMDQASNEAASALLREP